MQVRHLDEAKVRADLPKIIGELLDVEAPAERDARLSLPQTQNG